MTSAPANLKPPIQRKRRWFQFSLRTLLVLMLLFGGVFAWVGLRVQRAVQQRQAVRAIEALGGVVLFAEPSSFVQRSEWLRGHVGHRAVFDVESIDFASSTSTVGDAGLMHLRGLTQLQWLNLRGTQATDAGLVHLRGLTQLEWLNLSGTQATDAGLIHLHGLTQLQKLYIYDTQVSDAGVEKLRKALPNAEILGDP